ncbi:MAG TPA: hypothetical protein GXZ69_07755 [Spirochaetales bacterium]|nr:hypothetical protein [Spirochaetales bacterium]
MRINTVLLLVRAFLDGVRPIRTYFSRLTVPSQAKRVRTRILQLLIALLVGFSLIFLEVMIAFNYYTYQTLGSLLGTPYLGMFLATFVGFSLLFLIGFIGLSSIIYRGKDISLVSTLPVTEVELLVSRLMITYILYLPLYIGLVLPGIVVAIFAEGVNFLFVMGALFLLLLGPLLPLSLALLVATGLVRVSKGKRFRMFEQLFTFFITLGFYLAMIAAFTRNIGEGSSFQVDYQSLMLSAGTIFNTLTRLFPLFVAQARMLWSAPILMLQVVMLLVIPSLIALMVGRGYAHCLSLVASAQSQSRKRGRHHSYGSLSKTGSLMIRELEVIRSQSVFMIELVGELLIPLILLGVYALTGVLQEIQGLASAVASSPYLPYGIFLAVALFSSISMLSSTSVSRQGKEFSLDLILPVSSELFVRAKILLHMLLVGVSNLLYLMLALLFFRLSFVHLIWMAPLILVVVFCVAAFGLAIDYKRPLLTWSIPQQAMKSNLNGLLGMGSSLGVLVLVGLALLVPLVLGAGPFVGVALSLFVAIALAILAWRVVLACAYSAFSR